MASQTVGFEYDVLNNILFTKDDFEIHAESQVDEFLAFYEKKMTEINKKVYLVASIDGLKVGAKAYVYYGKRIKEFTAKWILGLARWGTDPLARMTVRAASITNRFDINIYNTKEAAIAAIEELKKTVA